MILPVSTSGVFLGFFLFFPRDFCSRKRVEEDTVNQSGAQEDNLDFEMIRLSRFCGTVFRRIFLVCESAEKRLRCVFLRKVRIACR